MKRSFVLYIFIIVVNLSADNDPSNHLFSLIDQKELTHIVSEIVAQAQNENWLEQLPENLIEGHEKLLLGKTLTNQELKDLQCAVSNKFSFLFQEDELGDTKRVRALRPEGKGNPPVSGAIDLSGVERLLCLLNKDLDECCEQLTQAIEEVQFTLTECCDELKELITTGGQIPLKENSGVIRHKIDEILEAVTGSTSSNYLENEDDSSFRNRRKTTVFQMVLEAIHTVLDARDETSRELENKISLVTQELDKSQQNIQKSVGDLSVGALNVEKHLLEAVRELQVGALNVEEHILQAVSGLGKGANEIEEYLTLYIKEMIEGAAKIRDQLAGQIEEVVRGGKMIEETILESIHSHVEEMATLSLDLKEKIKKLKYESRQMHEVVVNSVKTTCEHIDEQFDKMVKANHEAITDIYKRLDDHDVIVKEVKVSVDEIYKMLAKFFVHFYRSVDMEELNSEDI